MSDLRPNARPIWSGSGADALIDFTGRGTFFLHWYHFVCLAAEARDAAMDKVRADRKIVPAREALGAILFSALAAEALINELAEGAARNELPGITPGAHSEMLADLAAMLRMVEDSRGPIEPATAPALIGTGPGSGAGAF